MKDKYSFDDIMILPKEISSISSRKSIEVFDENGMLPLYTSPMLDVVSINNYKKYLKNKIYPIIPREKKYEDFLKIFETLNADAKLVFVSCSLDQFEKFVNTEFNDLPYRIRTLINNTICLLVDIANGHQVKLLKLAELCKKKYSYKIKLMVGNIANPITYEFYNRIGVDYIRVGIANGSGCETRLSGIGFPQASLVRETFEIKKLMNIRGANTKIISDGGHRDYPDIIKAMALGADGVMIGGIFNSMIESSGKLYFYKLLVPRKIGEFLFKFGFNIKKVYRGMSTKEVQKIIGDKKYLRTSEGIKKYNKINGSLETWTIDFIHHLRSAMSYCSIATLKSFIGTPKTIEVSQSSYQRIQKTK